MQSSSLKAVPQLSCITNSRRKAEAAKAVPLQPPIQFRSLIAAESGVKMFDLWLGNSEVSGAEDSVFKNTPESKIVLHILWPGYEEHLECYSKPNCSPTTRAQLGKQVADHYARFVEARTYDPCSIPEWQLGPRSIKFKQLFLVRLRNVYGNSWQADVAVDFSA